MYSCLNPKVVFLGSFLLSGFLFAGVASAADLVQPSADAPRYQLSNARQERDRFGRSVIAVDFRRTKAGAGSVALSGASAKGPVSISAFVPSSQESGTLHLSSMFGSRGGVSDLELFLVQNHRINATRTLRAMVSNSVRVGNPGTTTSPRAWTAEERKLADDFRRMMNDDSAHKPVKAYAVSMKPPEGFEFVPNTAKLTKGTKLQACFQSKWHPLTTISENSDGTINVRWDKYGPSFDCAMTRGELIAETALVAGLEKHPASKYPPTVPNWTNASAKTTGAPTPDAKTRKSYPVSIAVPSGSETVSADLKIKAGVALQACYAGKWNPITALSENEDGTLNVRWNDYGSGFDCSMLRAELIINKMMAQQLRTNPDAVQENTPPLRRKAYAVSIPVPRGSQFVPDNAVLKPGTKLQACYARKWNPITFLSHASDGTLNVHWDEYSSGFDCSMLREQLIIRSSELTQTTAAAEMRTFTDATGKFKVKAKIVALTGDAVTLLTDKGKEVMLPINKLSEPDQDFLRTYQSAENPFE